MIRTASLCSLFILASCSESPATKEDNKAVEAEHKEEMAETVKSEKKSLEEAADAAAKLVEEESRKEIDGLSRQ